MPTDTTIIADLAKRYLSEADGDPVRARRYMINARSEYPVGSHLRHLYTAAIAELALLVEASGGDAAYFDRHDRAREGAVRDHYAGGDRGDDDTD